MMRYLLFIFALLLPPNLVHAVQLEWLIEENIERALGDPPRLWLHVISEEQMQVGDAILDRAKCTALRGRRIEAMPIQTVDVGPSKSQLRYFKKLDEVEAQEMLALFSKISSIADLELKDLSEQYSEVSWIKLEHYELWLSPDIVQAQITPPQVSLLGSHDKYAVAEADGTMNANRDEVGPWERFILITNADDTVSFCTYHGKFVVAEENGNLNADRVQIGPWEKFKMIQNPDDTVSFQSHHGQYFVAEPDGSMNANREEIGPWEKFRLVE